MAGFLFYDKAMTDFEDRVRRMVGEAMRELGREPEEIADVVEPPGAEFAVISFAERCSYSRTGFPSAPANWRRGVWSDADGVVPRRVGLTRWCRRAAAGTAGSFEIHMGA